MRKTMPSVFVITMLSVLMMWPAFLNKGPAFFHDSISYLSAPTKAFHFLFGFQLDTFGTAQDVSRSDQLNLDESNGSHAEKQHVQYSIENPYVGRSIYYGVVVALLTAIVGFWSVPLLQSFIFSLALTLCIGKYCKKKLQATVFIGLCIAFFTTAPFFNIYIMPDFLAGLTIIAIIQLLASPEKLNKLEVIFWWSLLVFAVMSHTTHLLLAVVLSISVVLFGALFSLRKPFVGIVAVGLALACALTGEWLFETVVTANHGKPPLRPPFLAARLIDDGPGYTYLKERCPETNYEYCKYVGRLPVRSVDFLWSPDPKTGVFAVATDESRVKMSEQQFAFAIDVVAAYPIEQYWASQARFLEQLSNFSLLEFQYDDELRKKIENRWSETYYKKISSTKFFQNNFPIKFWSLVIYCSTVLSIFVIIFLFVLNFGKPKANMIADKHFYVFSIGLLLGLLGNAAISGVLSAPHDRYQARVVWLVCLLASTMIWRWLIETDLRNKTDKNPTQSVSASPEVAPIRNDG